LDPYPGCSCGAHTRSFPQDNGLPNTMTRSARSLSRPWHMTRTAISVRSTFTRLQSFANVQAREFARHPDCSYRSESLFRLPSKSLRVRWLFHRFRSGPQSDSLTPSQDSGNPLGSRGFYFRAYLSSLPPRAADILTVRFGQLTVEGLSPSKIRSLVGCSHSASRYLTVAATEWTLAGSLSLTP